MTEKKSTTRKPTKQTIAPGVEIYTTGKVLSKGTAIKIYPDIASIESIKRFFPTSSSNTQTTVEHENGFERAIASTEKECWRILEEAFSSTDPSIRRTLLEGEELLSGNLLHHVEAHGFRKREHMEWYAAKILISIEIVRKHIRNGYATHKCAECKLIAEEAVYVGGLIGEAKALKYFEDAGRLRRKDKREVLPIPKLIGRLEGRRRNVGPAELFKKIPKDQIDGIRIGEYKFYRKGDNLLVLKQIDGCKDWRPTGKPVGFGAFRKRVYAVRSKKN